MKRRPIIIILHIVLIILAYSSPFWLDWRAIALGIVLSYAQLIIFNGCVLSLAQFEDKDKTFHEWYLEKLGVKVNRKPFNLTLRYIVPFVLLGIALLFQVVFSTQVLVQL